MRSGCGQPGMRGRAAVHPYAGAPPDYRSCRRCCRDMSLHDTTVTTIRGDQVSMAEYSDTVALVVNVASRCGLTP